MTASKNRPRPGVAEPSASEDGVVGRKVPRVVAAAWTLFTKDGFQTTSMEAIAREAQVSKATIYAYFPSKEALFAHLINEECRRARALVTLPDLRLGIVAALRSFARQYVRIFLEEVPHRRAFFQMLVAEATRFPDLGQLMIDSGPKADVALLAGLIEEAHRKGLLDVADAKVAATQFLCLIRGELPIQSALGLHISTEADVDRTIEDGLSLFLKACRPGAAGDPQ